MLLIITFAGLPPFSCGALRAADTCVGAALALPDDDDFAVDDATTRAVLRYL